MHELRRTFRDTGVILAVASLFGFTPPVLAAEYGLAKVASQTPLMRSENLPTLFGNVMGTILSLISIVFFGLMLYGGIMWMTARGNDEQEKKARNTIIGAIIGVLIVLGSYALVSFVFGSL